MPQPPYSPDLKPCDSAIPAPFHVIQHTAQPFLHSQQLLSESRKLPRRFRLCSPTLQLIPTISQFYPFNITSPQQVSYHPFYGPKYFYTFVNSPMHATELTLLDFVSLILPGKQCKFLCHSVHYQMPQNIKKSVNPQKVQHF